MDGVLSTKRLSCSFYLPFFFRFQVLLPNSNSHFIVLKAILKIKHKYICKLHNQEITQPLFLYFGLYARLFFVNYVCQDFELSQNILKQECIPVRCVPPARWPYPVVSDGGGLPTPPPDADTPHIHPPRMQTPWMQTPPL